MSGEKKLRDIEGKLTYIMSAQSGKYKFDKMDFEKEYILEDPALDAEIKAFMKAKLDLQEIMSDPFLEATRTEISAMMSAQGSIKENESYPDKERYIKDALSRTESKTKTEINTIKITKSDINDLSAEWVREWHKKKQMQISTPADLERKSFISASVKSGEIMPSNKNTESTETTVNPQRKIRFLRFTSLAAAAVLGGLIAIKTLVPSGNPEKIYNSFYQPYDDAVTLATRGENSQTTRIYNQAVNSYKSGKYVEASIGFAEAASISPSPGTPAYYLGLVSMETGDYDQAVNHFLDVINRSGSYVKESRWYLGLTYLKTGDEEKAAECFRDLAKTEGYFSKQAEKILRRLE